MQTQRTALNFALFIKCVANAEAQLEGYRIALCEQPGFEIFSGFQTVVNFSATSISRTLLQDFLGTKDIEVSPEEAAILISLFDTDQDGELSYQEFIHAILPKTNVPLGKEVLRRTPSDIDDLAELPRELGGLLAGLFAEELRFVSEAQIIKQKLALRDDFNILGALKVVDEKETGQIDAEALQGFMKVCEMELAEDELLNFMIRCNKNLDEAVDYSEFITIFFPEDVFAREENLSVPTRNPQQIVQQPYQDNKEEENNEEPVPSPSLETPLQNANQAEVDYSPQDTRSAGDLSASLYRTPIKKNKKLSFADEVPEDITSPNDSISRPPKGSYFTVNMGEKLRSPLKPREENELAKAVFEMLQHIHALEVVKNDLAMKEDFNTYNAFMMFDEQNIGVISVKEFEEGFKRIELPIEKSELQLLMKRFDTDNVGLIRAEDFSRVIMPKSSDYVRLLSLREPRFKSEIANVTDGFSAETMDAYKYFLQTLIEEEVLCESIRQRLVKRKNFNLHDAYKSLDKYDNGYITSAEFRDMLEEKDITFSQKDVNTLVERFAKSVKGKISYSDFLLEMTPKSMKKYCD